MFDVDLLFVFSFIGFRRHDMIACFGETTGIETLRQILKTLQNCDEGMAILTDRPRINSSTIDLDALEQLPVGTLGYAYKQFLNDNVSVFE